MMSLFAHIAKLPLATLISGGLAVVCERFVLPASVTLQIVMPVELRFVTV